ncbi:hypothetical protein LCGC14_2364670, partial [marine sediment metagenome]
MRTCIIKPLGYVGDSLFAASAARKLKEEDQFDVVDLVTGFKQVEELLAYDEYLDHIVQLEKSMITFDGVSQSIHVPGYDAEFMLTETAKIIAPPMQAQMECGVREPDTKFEVTIDPEIVAAAKVVHPESYVAVMEVSSWKEKAFYFTQKQYEEGVDVPYLGYGGRLRDIDGILHRICRAGFELVYV